MPMYEYQCQVCKKVLEELSSMDQTNHSTGCLECMSPMIKVMSATPGFVQGGVSNRVALTKTSIENKSSTNKTSE